LFEIYTLTKKLNILFLCSWYPSEVLPTNGDFIQRHAEAVNLQHTVTALHIISKPGLTKTEFSEKNINNLKTLIAYTKPTNNPIVKIFRFRKAYKHLLKKIEKIDVVHVNRIFPLGLFAIQLKIVKKIPFIITEHWTGYHSTNSLKIGKLELITSKLIAKQASFICPVSKDLQKSMLNLGLNGHYKIVPNVVNTDLFKPQENKVNSFTITHISDLNNKHKNISGMIKTASKLSEEIDFKWNFIGGTNEVYKRELTKLNFNNSELNFIDHVSHKVLVEYLAKSDVFVMFSNFENLPCVILEAFSCGVPVISTDVGGIKEFFPKEFGTLIEKGNITELKNAIINLFNNPIMNKGKMHQYAVNNFSPTKICNAYTDLYFKSIH